jgi:hypothetical protein
MDDDEREKVESWPRVFGCYWGSLPQWRLTRWAWTLTSRGDKFESWPHVVQCHWGSPPRYHLSRSAWTSTKKGLPWCHPWPYTPFPIFFSFLLSRSAGTTTKKIRLERRLWSALACYPFPYCFLFPRFCLSCSILLCSCIFSTYNPFPPFL